VCKGTTLHFSADSIVKNDLAGSGWWGGGGTMHIKNVAPDTGKRVDLYISDHAGNFDRGSSQSMSGYSAGEWSKQLTGLYEKDGQEYGVIRIAMESAKDWWHKQRVYEFKFELKDESGNPVTLDEFPLVFYDMDYEESVEACGTAGTAVNEGTRLTKSTPSDGCVKYTADSSPAQSPKDFDHPTKPQQQASVSFIYKDTSKWIMKFAMQSSHRWVLFKSSKALACE
jgi:hypothetical protein